MALDFIKPRSRKPTRSRALWKQTQETDERRASLNPSTALCPFYPSSPAQRAASTPSPAAADPTRQVQSQGPAFYPLIFTHHTAPPKGLY